SPGTSLASGVDFGGGLIKSAAVKSTDEIVVRGQLRDDTGRGVGGATVCVFETINLDDASRELTETARTQSNGRVATRLDPGPTRDLEIIYRYNNRVLQDRASIKASVVPTLALSKRSLRNGEAEFFTGTLPGPRADSRSVALQAKVGKKWRTFKQLTTDPRGRFRGKYKFVGTVGTGHYRFRALVKGQGGYPYEPGFSRRAKVLVRG